MDYWWLPDFLVMRICLLSRRPGLSPWVGKIPWRRDRLPTPVFLGFPGGSENKESACNAGDLGSIPGLGRSPGEGNSYPLQYSCLENSIDREAWQVTVYGVTKSWAFTFLSLTFIYTHTHPLSGYWYPLSITWQPAVRETLRHGKLVCFLNNKEH